jgi:hypothetical protein
MKSKGNEVVVTEPVSVKEENNAAMTPTKKKYVERNRANEEKVKICGGWDMSATRSESVSLKSSSTSSSDSSDSSSSDSEDSSTLGDSDIDAILSRKKLIKSRKRKKKSKKRKSKKNRKKDKKQKKEREMLDKEWEELRKSRMESRERHVGPSMGFSPGVGWGDASVAWVLDFLYWYKIGVK